MFGGAGGLGGKEGWGLAGAHCFDVAPVEAKVKEGRGRRRGTAGPGWEAESGGQNVFINM